MERKNGQRSRQTDQLRTGNDSTSINLIPFISHLALNHSIIISIGFDLAERENIAAK